MGVKLPGCWCRTWVSSMNMFEIGSYIWNRSLNEDLNGYDMVYISVYFGFLYKVSLRLLTPKWMIGRLNPAVSDRKVHLRSFKTGWFIYIWGRNKNTCFSWMWIIASEFGNPAFKQLVLLWPIGFWLLNWAFFSLSLRLRLLNHAGAPEILGKSKIHVNLFPTKTHH